MSGDAPEASQPPPLTPFLKWAGGKRWLLTRYRWLFPDGFGRYLEPFLGSGSVFFQLRPKSSVLGDANKDLIELFGAIRDNYALVEFALKRHAAQHSHEYYYAVRASDPSSATDRAARMLYLNRTCWNALYRVNRQGAFNVPKGTKDKVLLETDDFRSASSALRGAVILHSDFERIVDQAAAGDFVFVDPPYTVAHNNNGFNKYNQDLFSWSDQERLAASVRRAVERGAMVLVTNADHSSIKRLYDGIGHVVKLERATVISGKNEGRKRTSELAIAAGYQTAHMERHLASHFAEGQQAARPRVA